MSNLAAMLRLVSTDPRRPNPKLLNAAADEIERLRAENDRLRMQLRGITQSDPDAELVAEVERLRRRPGRNDR